MDTYEYLLDHSELDKLRFAEAALDCAEICYTIGGLGSWDGSGDPSFNSSSISFNGKDQIGDSFAINRTGSSGRSCNTGGKPYDLAVRCCLLIFKHHFGEDISIHSGGDNWDFAREKVKSILHY